MSATLAVRPHRSHAWIFVVFLVAAIVATVALTAAAFTGWGSEAPAKSPPAPVVSPLDPCSKLGADRMGC